MPAPPLETPRLHLRSIVPADRESLVAILADPVAMAHMHYRTWNDAQRQGWVDLALELAGHPDPEGISWVIERADCGEVIGWFGMGNPADPAIINDISFEYALARAHWNQGVMTEVLGAIFAHAFDTLGLPRLYASCHTANLGSARVMQKAGMSFTHTDTGPDPAGTMQTQDFYEITRAAWHGMHETASPP